ncbi:TetR family transcriptional regulator [Aliidongia dinghuensis]|uniref:TetR family transcriptional regulator n=1 Tax=Aliidongia dinghuensis TaxID=1867774 RepID=A0A8J2YQ65_9PROT|nr:TetR/AcrR family transcriptional regulator [Aliidongia dinghuensis]GGF03292.1 TetR family transcriptional regulator [Aliidongia dinghuensis]
MTNVTPLPDRAGPGRPREFDIDEAVRDAIEVFRAHGYHGTSVQDLTEGTGLARGSLYKAFHDKRTLFLAALDHYTAASLQRISDALSAPGSARAAIREALLGYARRSADQGRQGCIVTGAAMEMVPDDAEVSAAIDRLFRRTRDLFAAAIIRGQAAGEIPHHYDERAIARHLHCTMQGLRVLGRTGPSEQDLIDIVDQAMRSLD